MAANLQLGEGGARGTTKTKEEDGKTRLASGVRSSGYREIIEQVGL
jgi:hypothetical protein